MLTPCLWRKCRAPKQGPLVLYLPRVESWAVTRIAGGYQDLPEHPEQPERVHATSLRAEAAPAAAQTVAGGSPRAVACSPCSRAFAPAASPFG